LDTALIIKIVLAGIGATIVFDLWGQFLKYAFKITPSNICFVGRWFLYMPGGVFTHSNIGKSAPKNGECAAGWIAHYMIGITLASIFALLIGSGWFESPALLPAMLFGIVTAAAPLFIMQPSFGFGFAASKSPNPMQARIRSLMNHAAFGAGLYISAVLLKPF
jgi:fatty acid desaturase